MHMRMKALKLMPRRFAASAPASLRFLGMRMVMVVMSPPTSCSCSSVSVAPLFTSSEYFTSCTCLLSKYNVNTF